jgi:hypothetical protein
MTFKQAVTQNTTLARISILTIVHHDRLAAHTRIYVWFASATTLVLTIFGIISLETALYALLWGAVGTGALLGLLIAWRKAILLNIREDALRCAAHEAMLALIRSRKVRHPVPKRRKGHFRRWLEKFGHF